MVDEPGKTGYNISIAWLRGAAQTLRCIILYAPVMELVDMRDLGSRAFGVWVRVPSGAPNKSDNFDTIGIETIRLIFSPKCLLFKVFRRFPFLG